MTNSFPVPRNILILIVVLPIAAVAGYMMATPDFLSWGVVGMILLALVLPVFLKWHHTMLILSWNLAVQVFFLPGSPPLWMLMAVGSLGLAVLGRVLDKERRLLFVPSVSWPLIVLGLVVLFTLKMNGGFGIRSFGGAAYGGKKYVFVLLAIVAYFALSCQRLQPEKWKAAIGAFFLPGLAVMMSNIAYALGPAFWFLFYLFPVDMALSQAMEDFGGIMGPKFGRLTGLAPAGLAAYSYLLCRYGIRGILDWTRPWRAVTFALIVGLSLLSGFRSTMVTYILIFAIQFFLEGLHRTRLLPVVLLGTTLLLAGLTVFATRLPISVQRCFTIIPFIEVDPVAKMNAEGSADWRMEMWRVLLPEVSKHFWLGKGFVASEAEHYLTMESVRRGLAVDFETSIVAGDYHNGPLSVMIPFGVFGAAAFVAFVIAGFRALILNYRYGSLELRQINTALLSLFAGRLIFFCSIFGAVHLDLLILAGLVGLSVSLNGGIRRECSKEVEAAEGDRSPGPGSVSALTPALNQPFGRRR